MGLPRKPRKSRSEIIEMVAKTVTTQEIISAKSLKEWQACPLKVFAVRGYFAPNKNKRGVYDDAFFVSTSDGDFVAFNGNVDPSLKFREGLAQVKTNQVVWYKPGKHGLSRKDGGYPAFRQASDIVVHRDADTGPGKRVGKGLFKDRSNLRFWINNHRGGWGTTSSLGCLTIPPHDRQWETYRDLVTSRINDFQLPGKQFPILILNPIV